MFYMYVFLEGPNNAPFVGAPIYKGCCPYLGPFCRFLNAEILFMLFILLINFIYFILTEGAL